MDEKDKGFTLVELLVVMIIIGILAAIAIPVFMNQRKKAVDTAARSDVSTIGKEIATYYVDATTPLTEVTVNGTTKNYVVAGNDIGRVSNGVGSPSLTPGSTTDVNTAAQNWCVQVTVTGGTKTNVSYSAKNGLQDTACS
ncbi:type II secretion system protein [Cellulomonas sp. GbtcB1]|uniref:type II secretion system protein n=1 Tax=Cellulomonas sp. GbtcB1 TaxID=2824746 RepID=UPI0020C5ED04|nr:prepilin-type N-terminal cleavage/methylation domain-containing protein [Cellulomonas sp. GbtcB1]